MLSPSTRAPARGTWASSPSVDPQAAPVQHRDTSPSRGTGLVVSQARERLATAGGNQASRDAMPSGSFATSDTIVVSVPIPSRRSVWTAEAGGWLRVRNIETGEIAHQHHFNISRLITAIGASERRVWVGHRDGTISIFDAETLGPVLELQLHEGAVTGIGSVPSLGRVLSVAVDGRLVVWDDETMRCLTSNTLGLGPLSCVTSGVVTHGGDAEQQELVAFVGSQEGELRVTTMMGAVLPRPNLSVPVHTGAMNCLHHDPTTGYLWTGGQDSRIKVFDARDLSNFEQLAVLSDHTSPVTSILINRGEGKVWALSKSGTCIIFESRHFKAEQYIQGGGAGYGGRSASLTAEASQPIVSVCATHQTYVWRFWICGGEGTVRLFTSPSDPPALTPADLTNLTASLNRQLGDEVRSSSDKVNEMQRTIGQLSGKVQDLTSNEQTLLQSNTDLATQTVALKESLERETSELSTQLIDAKTARDRAEKELAELRQELQGKAESERTIFAHKQELQRAQQTILEAVSNNEKLRADVEALRATEHRNKAALETLHLELDKERMSKDRLQKDLHADVDARDGIILQLRSQLEALGAQLDRERNKTPPASPPRGPFVVRMDMETLAGVELQSRTSIQALETWSRSILSTLVHEGANQQVATEEVQRRLKKDLDHTESARKELDIRCDELDSALAVKNQEMQKYNRDHNDAARNWKDKLVEAQAEVDSLSRQSEAAREKISRLEKEKGEAAGVAEKRLEALTAKLQDQVRTATEDREILTTELESALVTSKALRTDLDVTRSKYAQAENHISSFEDTQRTLETRAGRAEKKCLRLEADVVERESEISKLTIALTQPKDDTHARNLTDQLNRKDAEYKNSQKEVERLQRLQHDLETALELERQRLSDAEKTQRVAVDKSERALMAEENARAQASLAEDNHRATHNQLQSTVDQLRRDLKLAEDSRSSLEASLSKIQQSSQRSLEEKNLQVEKAEMKLTASSAEIEELKNAMNALTTSKSSQMSAFVSENDNLVGQMRSLRQDLHRTEEERDRFRQAHDTLQDATTNHQTLKQEIKNLNATKIDLETALGTTEQRARVAEQDRERALVETARFRQEVQTTTRSVDQLRRELSEKDGEVQALRAGVAAKEREWTDKAVEQDNHIAKLRVDISKRHKDIDDLQEAKARVEAEAKRQLAVVQNEMQQMDSEVSSLQRQIHEGALQSDRVILQGEVTELRQTLGNVQRDLNAKRQEIRDERQRTVNTENELTSKIRDEQNTVYVVKGEVHQVQQQLKAKEEERAVLQRRLDEALKRNEDTAQDVASRLNGDIAKLRGENSVLSTENIRLSTENTGLARQLESIGHDHKVALRNQKSEHERGVLELNNQIADLQKELRIKGQELSTAIKSAEETEVLLVNKNRTDHSVLSSQVDDAKHTAISYQSNAQAQAGEFQRLRIQFEERIQALEAQLQSERHTSEKEFQDHGHEVRSLQKELKARSSEILSLKGSLEDIEADITTKFRNERTNQMQQNEMLKDQVSTLQRDLKNRLNELLLAQRALDETEVTTERQWREERNAMDEKITRLEFESSRFRDTHSAREAELRDHSVASERMRAQLAKVNAERAMVLAEVDDLREENQKLNSSVRSMQVELSTLAEDYGNERSLNATVQGRLRAKDEDHLNDTVRLEQSARVQQSELEAQVADLKAEAKKQQRNAMVLETMVEEVREQAKGFLADKERLAAELATLKGQCEDAQLRLDRAMKEVYTLREIAAQYDAAQRRAEEAELDADTCRKRLKELELCAQGDELSRRDELHNLRNQLSASDEDRKRLMEELEAAQRVLERVRGDTTNSLDRAHEMELKVRDLTDELDIARRKIAGLEETLALAQAVTGKRDIPYIERQVALVGQLLRRATGNEMQENVSRAQAALGDVLSYLRNSKIQEQQGSVLTPNRGGGQSPWT